MEICFEVKHIPVPLQDQFGQLLSQLFISACVCLSLFPGRKWSVLWFSFEVPSEIICPIYSEELHPLMVVHCICCRVVYATIFRLCQIKGKQNALILPDHAHNIKNVEINIHASVAAKQNANLKSSFLNQKLLDSTECIKGDCINVVFVAQVLYFNMKMIHNDKVKGHQSAVHYIKCPFVTESGTNTIPRFKDSTVRLYLLACLC